MEISYLGQSSFRIKGKTVTVVTDPFSREAIGLSYPKIEADIVTVSHEHPDHNAVWQIGGDPFIISAPGEYEVKGAMVFGIPVYHDTTQGSERGKVTAYSIEFEGLRLCHLGDLGSRLTSEQLEELGEKVDILFIPVGGVSTIGPDEATEVIGQIDPKIVLPMHYKVPGMKEETYGALREVTDFLKSIGEESAPVPKLVITSDKLPEERQIVVLERKS